MATSKFTPPPVPLDAPASVRQYLDEQMRRLQVLVNGAAQRDEAETVSAVWTFSPDVDGMVADFGSASDATTSTKYVRIRSNGYAGLHVQGDASNRSGEPGGAWVALTVDGFAPAEAGSLLLSRVQNAGEDGRGGSFSGTSGNAGLIACPAANPLHFGTNGVVRMTLQANGAPRWHSTDQTGVPVTVEGIHAALVNLGLITA